MSERTTLIPTYTCTIAVGEDDHGFFVRLLANGHEVGRSPPFRVRGAAIAFANHLRKKAQEAQLQ